MTKRDICSSFFIPLCRPASISPPNMTKLWYFTFDFLHLIAEISLDIAKKPFALGFSLAKRRLSFSMRRPNSRHSCGFRARPKMKTLIFLNETKNWDYNHRFRTIIGSTLLYLFIYIYIYFIRTLFSFDHLPLQLQWNSPNSQHPSSSRWGGGKSVLFEFGMFFVRLLFQRGLGNEVSAIFSAEKSPRDFQQRSDERNETFWRILRDSAGVFMNLEEEKGAIQIYLEWKTS